MLEKELLDELIIEGLASSPLGSTFILNGIGSAAMFEQLAEECTELAKASLKKARIIREDNPTPVTHDEADAAIIEEFTDIIHVASILGLDKRKDFDQIHEKQKRWIKRIIDASQE